jgi:hypothetical protein
VGLFYEFNLDDVIPKDHLLRRMNIFVTGALSDLHQQLRLFHSDIGRPSVASQFEWMAEDNKFAVRAGNHWSQAPSSRSLGAVHNGDRRRRLGPWLRGERSTCRP